MVVPAVRVAHVAAGMAAAAVAAAAARAVELGDCRAAVKLAVEEVGGEREAEGDRGGTRVTESPVVEGSVRSHRLRWSQMGGKRSQRLRMASRCCPETASTDRPPFSPRHPKSPP